MDDFFTVEPCLPIVSTEESVVVKVLQGQEESDGNEGISNNGDTTADAQPPSGENLDPERREEVDGKGKGESSVTNIEITGNEVQTTNKSETGEDEEKASQESADSPSVRLQGGGDV